MVILSWWHAQDPMAQHSREARNTHGGSVDGTGSDAAAVLPVAEKILGPFIGDRRWWSVQWGILSVRGQPSERLSNLNQ